MGAPKGNKYYLLAEDAGRPRIFETIEQVLKVYNDYVINCEQNPIPREESHPKQGTITIDIPMALTKEGFCHFANITSQTFDNYKKKEDYKEFFDIFTRIENAFYTQNYNLAAARVHDPGLAARKLGIKDKKDLTSGDGTMSPKEPTLVINYEGKPLSMKDD